MFSSVDVHFWHSSPQYALLFAALLLRSSRGANLCPFSYNIQSMSFGVLYDTYNNKGSCDINQEHKFLTGVPVISNEHGERTFEQLAMSGYESNHKGGRKGRTACSVTYLFPWMMPYTQLPNVKEDKRKDNEGMHSLPHNPSREDLFKYSKLNNGGLHWDGDGDYMWVNEDGNNPDNTKNYETLHRCWYMHRDLVTERFYPDENGGWVNGTEESEPGSLVNQPAW